MANRGEIERSIARFDQALVLATAKGAHERALQCLGSLGSLYMDLASFDKALETYSEALALARRLDNQSGICASQMGIGAALLAIGEITGWRSRWS